MSITTADITKNPPYLDQDVELLWIIASAIEGTAISESLSDFDPQDNWSSHTKLLYLIANGGADGGGIVLADIPFRDSWNNTFQLLHYKASQDAEATLPFTLSDLKPRATWSINDQLLYIICQGEGVYDPLNISEINYRPDWSIYTKLLYIWANFGSTDSNVGFLELWHQYKSTETESQRVQDYSGTNRGTLYSGSALDFDGVNDIVTIGTNISQSVGTYIAKVMFNGGVVGGQMVLGHTSGSPFTYPMFVTNTPGNSKVTMRTTTGGYQLLADSDFEDDVVYEICVVKTSSTLKLYVDGIENYSVSAGGTVNFKTIGDHYTGGNWPVSGLIGGVKCFSVALSAAQVLENFENPEQILPTGVASSSLKLYLPMVEGSGSTIYDGSGNSNNGSVSGTTWENQLPDPWLQLALVNWNEKTTGVFVPEGLTAGSDITGIVLDHTKLIDSLNLNSRSKVLVPKTGDIAFGSKGTIIVWVKASANQNNPVVSTLPGVDYINMKLGAGGGAYVAAWKNKDLPGEEGYELEDVGAVEDPVVPIKQLILSIGPSGLGFYVNGVLQNSSTDITSWPENANDYAIGTDGTNFFRGEILELKMYSTDFDASEAQGSYNNECEAYGLVKI
jgi:hypothetical protein